MKLPVRLTIVLTLALTALLGNVIKAGATIGPDYSHLRPHAIEASEYIKQVYPQIPEIGGWRPIDPFPDHPSGKAIDVMIPNAQSPEGIALGNQIVEDLHARAVEFGLQYTIWRQYLQYGNGSGHQMSDRGSPTQNHFDHVHVMTS